MKRQSEEQSAFPRRWALFVWLPLALLLLLAATQDLWLGAVLRADLEAHSGRSVRIERVRIGLAPTLAPIVRAAGVRIENAAWATSREPFVALDRAVVHFSWRSVAERRPVIDRLVLEGGSVDLERRADDLRNWRLRNPDDRGPGRYKILRLEPHDLRVRYAHGGIDLDFAAGAVASSAADAALPTRIDAAGRWRGVAFTVGVDTASTLTFLETDERFRLRGRAAVEGLGLDVDGAAGDLFRAPTLDADVAVKGRSLAALAPFIGHGHATPRAFDGKGHLRADDRSYAIDGLAATIGGTDLAGRFAWSRTNGRRSLHADLKSRSADVDDVRWLIGRAPPPGVGKAVKAAASAASAAGEAMAAARDDAKAASAPSLHGDAKVAAPAPTRWTVPREPDGVGVAGGRARGRVAVDGRGETPLVEADVGLSGLRLLELSPSLAGKLEGVLGGHVALRARGGDWDAWRRDVAGTLRASVGDGRIASGLDARLGLELGKVARTFLSGDSMLPLTCASAVVDVKGGRATLRSLVVESANTRTTGRGGADFGTGTVDVLLTPEPKRAGLFDLRRSIRLTGPIGKPQRALVEREAIGPDGCPAPA